MKKRVKRTKSKSSRGRTKSKSSVKRARTKSESSLKREASKSKSKRTTSTNKSLLPKAKRVATKAALAAGAAAIATALSELQPERKRAAGDPSNDDTKKPTED